MANTSRSTVFQSLLQQLSDEHEQQLSRVHTKISELQVELGRLEPDNPLVERATPQATSMDDEVSQKSQQPLKPPSDPADPAAPLTLPPHLHLSMEDDDDGVTVQDKSDRSLMSMVEPSRSEMSTQSMPFVDGNEQSPQDPPLRGSLSSQNLLILNESFGSSQQQGEYDSYQETQHPLAIASEHMNRSAESDGTTSKHSKKVLFSESLRSSPGNSIAQEMRMRYSKKSPSMARSTSSGTVGTMRTAVSKLSTCSHASSLTDSFNCHAIWMENVSRPRGAFGKSRVTRANLDAINPQHAKTAAQSGFAFAGTIAADIIEGKKCRHRLIVNPSAPKRLLWDVLGAALIAYDIVMIPMALFDLPESSFLIFMNWFTLFFWSFDIVTSFFVGYVSNGITIMDPDLIAKNYLKSWFALDVMIVVCDWAYNLANSSDSAGNSNVGDLGRFARIMRSVRTLRLVRLLKLKRLVAAIQDHVDSEYLAILGDVVKLVIIMIVFSHWIACVWYAIGRAGNHDSWIKENNMGEESLEMRYVTSLHWSVTQLLLEGMDVDATNIVERCFSICTLIFGLLVFSSVVSRITNSMIQLQKMGQTTYTQFWLLRRYCREHRVPKVLSARIQRFLEYACQKQDQHVQESRVTILALLSQQLRDELQYAIVIPQIHCHPLFHHISRVSDVTMHRLCRCAILRWTLAREDSVFFKVEFATKMYFVVSGEQAYRRDADAAPEPVFKGEWICEAALWTAWVHVGDMYAATECDMISIDAAEFGNTMKTNLMIWGLAAEYAVDFVASLNARQKDDLTDLSDGVTPELLECVGRIFASENVSSGDVSGPGTTLFRWSTSMSTLNPFRMLKSAASSNSIGSEVGTQSLSRVCPERSTEYIRQS